MIYGRIADRAPLFGYHRSPYIIFGMLLSAVAVSLLPHIMIRGVKRRRIFINDRDREDFLERFSKLLPATDESGESLARENGYRLMVE